MQKLIMNLDAKAKTPLYEQIYNYIKHDIQSGQIKAREKLPSSRSLASAMVIWV